MCTQSVESVQCPDAAAAVPNKRTKIWFSIRDCIKLCLHTFYALAVVFNYTVTYYMIIMLHCENGIRKRHYTRLTGYNTCIAACLIISMTNPCELFKPCTMRGTLFIPARIS